MKLFRHLAVFLAVLGFAALPCAQAQKSAKGQYLVYFGTYTGKNSKGIYAYRLDVKTGGLDSLGLAGETPSPSFLAVHSNRKFLYAVSEVADFEGKKAGAVAAFRIHPDTGKLDLLNKVSSGGAGPCHVSVDRTGKYVFVANYTGGSVAVLPIRDDGSLAEASAFVQHASAEGEPKPRGGPHAHSIHASFDNRFVIAADLGLDKLLVYRFNASKGSLEPNDPPFASVAQGSGPRHFAFHPNGKFGFVINERKLTVTAFSYDASRGAFQEIQTISTLPEGFTGERLSTAEVQVHPSGKFLYGSNRGHDSIAVFSIDTGKGTLKPIEHVPTQGRIPRNFGIDPTGSYLFAANQNSDNVVVFSINPKTGRLTPTGKVLDVPMPVCVKFVALGN
jgi:6-phosphogluconolactonase